MEHLTITIDAETLANLRITAKAECETVSAYIRRAVRERMAKCKSPYWNKPRRPRKGE